MEDVGRSSEEDVEVSPEWLPTFRGLSHSVEASNTIALALHVATEYLQPKTPAMSDNKSMLQLQQSRQQFDEDDQPPIDTQDFHVQTSKLVRDIDAFLESPALLARPRRDTRLDSIQDRGSTPIAAAAPAVGGGSESRSSDKRKVSPKTFKKFREARKPSLSTQQPNKVGHNQLSATQKSVKEHPVKTT